MTRYRCWAELRLELDAIEAASEEDAIELADGNPWIWPQQGDFDYKVINILAEEDE